MKYSCMFCEFKCIQAGELNKHKIVNQKVHCFFIVNSIHVQTKMHFCSWDEVKNVKGFDILELEHKSGGNVWRVNLELKQQEMKEHFRRTHKGQIKSKCVHCSV